MAKDHRSPEPAVPADAHATAAERARRLFLAKLSHEIRTPLNGVLGMAQAMAGDDLNAAQRQRLEVLRQSGETLLLILNDLVGAAPAEREPAPPGPVSRPPTPERPPRVLAAEDNPVNQVVLRALLEQAGIEPFIVDDGAACVDAWRTAEWDVILMDVQMPVLDGLGASRAIRAAETTSGRRRTPILALTASALASQAADYAEAGMDGLIAKPIHVEELFSRIEAALDLTEKDALPSRTARR
ncbi:response regulator [Phenylobacterium sp.]|uniref:response regulator n=1 Tax=Phenylobacterium sp. TaxID=1871053 RepID=UPI0025EF1CA5|nr:response regulator [Phenylobacterium sp.]